NCRWRGLRRGAGPTAPALIARCNPPRFPLQTIEAPFRPRSFRRTHMALLTRIYFNAVFGALGGLLGWVLFGFLSDRIVVTEPTPAQQTSSEDERARNQVAHDATTALERRQQVFGGAVIGGCIGFFVVSVEALRDRSLLRFLRLASYGLALGTVG